MKQTPIWVDILILVMFMAYGIGVLYYIEHHNPFEKIERTLAEANGEKRIEN